MSTITVRMPGTARQGVAGSPGTGFPWCRLTAFLAWSGPCRGADMSTVPVGPAAHVRGGYPMRPDITPGGIFPDYALPDHTSTIRTLSELQGGDPLILTLARGHYCPKEHQQHLELAAFYPKIAVAYTQVVTIATDEHHTLQEFRASVGAQWTFLSDPGRIIQKDRDIQEYTDPEHDPRMRQSLAVVRFRLSSPVARPTRSPCFTARSWPFGTSCWTARRAGGDDGLLAAERDVGAVPQLDYERLGRLVEAGKRSLLPSPLPRRLRCRRRGICSLVTLVIAGQFL